MQKDNNPDLVLRISVESGGCHGFQYLMSLVDTASLDAEADSLFVYSENKGQGPPELSESIASSRGQGMPKIVLDEPSLQLLEGSKVDYTMELIGSQFKVVDNPRAQSSCGCGTSFDVKALGQGGGWT